MVKISIIIPIYNMEKYLEECLDSILFQELQEIEIICIDDGSTDNSTHILETYAINNENIIVIHQKNKGAGAARNVGITYAMGKYIGFMDADDYYPDSTVLKKLYETAEKEGALICGGNIVSQKKDKLQTEWFNENGMREYIDFQELYCFYKYIYSARMLKNNNIMFPEYERFEDPPFLVKAMICAREFYAMKDTVYVYRCGYKVPEYSAEKVEDMLRGMRDICMIGKEYRLYKLNNTVLHYMTSDFRDYIYRYIYKGNRIIIHLIGEIALITEADVIKERFSLDTINRYVRSCMKEREELLMHYSSYKGVIVYGAGGIGISALKYLKKKKINIIGVAVTKRNAVNLFEGYEVKEIKDFVNCKECTLVVIGAGIRYRNEIRDNLYKLGFMHVIDFNKIRFVETI